MQELIRRKRLLAILFLLSTGCEIEPPNYKNFYFVGEKTPYAQCKWYTHHACGLRLWGCTSGREYYCGVEIRP